MDDLAETMADDLAREWEGAVRGVSLLDDVFGYDHNLLATIAQGNGGFGIQDGIWHHRGWQPLPTLQRRLASLPELRDLLSRLGRRTTSTGKEMRRFRPRKRSTSRDDAQGVELDPMEPASVSGVTLSGNLAIVLPNEAVLLRSERTMLRWLFLAKMAEEKLL